MNHRFRLELDCIDTDCYLSPNHFGCFVLAAAVADDVDDGELVVGVGSDSDFDSDSGFDSGSDSDVDLDDLRSNVENAIEFILK